MRFSSRSGPGSTARSVLDRLRRQRKQLDRGLVLALALGLFAAIPFLSRAGLPHQTDAELHVYRAAELGHAIGDGVVYPRWAPNLYLGYGYPIFNYYAPLTYYLSYLLALALPGAGIVAGVRAVFVLGFMAGSLGTYLLGRELFDAEGGVLAAASFALSPYVLFIDPHARGDLAEFFAICLIPLTFSFFHGLMRSPARRSLLASVFSLAAVVFSHNLTGLVAGGLLLGYWCWHALGSGERQKARWGVIAFVLAASLTAFFWLPALLESRAIKLEVIGPGHFDFREHFLSLGELLGPSQLIDWGATGPRFRHNLGVLQWLLALPSVLVVARWRGAPTKEGRGRSFPFFLTAGAALIFLTLPVSKGVWELVPVMAYLQFPWRLLGPANFMLAVCGAGSVSLLPDKPWRRAAVVCAFVLIMLTALPLLYPSPWPTEFGGTSPVDIIEWEQRSQALGTTSTGDFLPVTVEMIPPPMETLVESYRSEGPIDKVNRATVPNGATVTILEHRANYDHFEVTTAEAFRLRLYTFYFPGWRAYVDGEEVEIEVARPEGFITLDVPAGHHDVLVRFEDTPPRKAGVFVSIGGLMALTAVCASWWPEEDGEGRTPRSGLAAASWWWLASVVILILAVKVMALDPLGGLAYRSPPGQALPAEQKLRADFGGKIELLGYDLPKRRVRAGDTLTVVLYWHALADMKENYQSFVHVAEPLNVAWAQEDHLNPGGFPTSRWPQDKYVWDEYRIRIPREMPAGDYRINVGLYLRSDGSRLERRDADQPGADSIVIGSVEVLEPR